LRLSQTSSAARLADGAVHALGGLRCPMPTSLTPSFMSADRNEPAGNVAEPDP